MIWHFNYKKTILFLKLQTQNKINLSEDKNIEPQIIGILQPYYDMVLTVITIKSILFHKTLNIYIYIFYLSGRYFKAFYFLYRGTMISKFYFCICYS